MARVLQTSIQWSHLGQRKNDWIKQKTTYLKSVNPVY